MQRRTLFGGQVEGCEDPVGKGGGIQAQGWADQPGAGAQGVQVVPVGPRRQGLHSVVREHAQGTIEAREIEQAGGAGDEVLAQAQGFTPRGRGSR